MRSKTQIDFLIDFGLSILICLVLSASLILPSILLSSKIPGTWVAIITAVIVFALVMGLSVYLSKSNRYRIIAIVVVLLGLVLILGALRGSDQEVSWNVNLFGTGVGVVALGMMCFTLLNRRERKETAEKLTEDVSDAREKLETRDSAGRQRFNLGNIWQLVGVVFLGLAVLLLLVLVYFCFAHPSTSLTGLIGFILTLTSVGLGCTGIGIARESDRKYMDILNRIDIRVGALITGLDDQVTPSQTTPSPMLNLFSTGMPGTKDKIAAQRRLDEDTKRVGYVRGEVFQTEGGRWAIHWGGRYPL